MGRGNVCVTGDYEGLFYVDYDNYKSFKLDDDGNETEEYDYEIDEDAMEYGIQEFSRNFCKRFVSFHKENKRVMVRYPCYRKDLRVIAENDLFYACVEDNEWSFAVELIQKDYRTEHYEEWMVGLQKRHCQEYLDGIRDCLLELYPEIGTYACAWTSGVIRKNDVVSRSAT